MCSLCKSTTSYEYIETVDRYTIRRIIKICNWCCHMWWAGDGEAEETRSSKLIQGLFSIFVNWVGNLCLGYLSYASLITEFKRCGWTWAMEWERCCCCWVLSTADDERKRMYSYGQLCCCTHNALLIIDLILSVNACVLAIKALLLVFLMAFRCGGENFPIR